LVLAGWAGIRTGWNGNNYNAGTGRFVFRCKINIQEDNLPSPGDCLN
jgi:hypothetical protein